MLTDSKPKLLLLHGAYHGPWIWELLISELRTVGVECLSPELSFSPDPDLEELAQLVQGRYVAIAHSLAGTLVPHLHSEGMPTKPLKSILLCAYLPSVGQSVTDLVRLDHGSAMRGAVRVDRAADYVTVDSRHAAQAFYGDEAEHAAAVRALRSLHGQPLSSFERKAAFSFPAGQPYLVCTRDRAITPSLQRRMAADARCSPVLDIDSGHMPMITHSSVLAKAILTLAPELLD